MKKDNLNDEQLKAVQTTEGPLLIIASAGSGKTKVLVERTTYLLREKNILPENILLSTFTEKASNELLVRISENLKNIDSKININNMYIGTLHSIFLKIITENIEYSLFKENFKILDELDQTFFIYSKIHQFNKLTGYKEFFKNIPVFNSWDRSRKIRNWINKLNESGKNLKDIKTDNNEILFLSMAQKLYQTLLIEHNVIDFTTIQQEVYRLLLNNHEVLERLREKIKYIMIDEYQDTNDIQEKIIFLLGKNQNICVVGDDDQGIYRFRGASVKNILQFPGRFDKNVCQVINLNKNYRSHKDIIKFCNNWISLINWRGFRFEKYIEPPTEKQFYETPAVLRLAGNSEAKWKENILKFIKKLISTNKIKDFSQIGFLFRSVQNQNVKELKKYLESFGIPVYSPRSKDFFDKSEIKLIIGAFLAYFPHNKEIIFNEVRNRKNHVFYYYRDCLELLKKEVKNDIKFHNWIVQVRKDNLQKNIHYYLSLKEIFYQFLQFDTFKKFMEDKAAYNLGIFTNILEKFEVLTKVEKIKKEDLSKVLNYFFMVYLNQLFLKRIDEYEDKEDFPKEAIPFLTFHQAKGLEFPVVIVGSLDSNPKPKIKTYEDTLEEILKLSDDFEPEEMQHIFDFWRVYYTAFSRAKDLLVLTTIENRSSRNELPSRSFRTIYESIPYVDENNVHFEKFIISNLKQNSYKETFSFTGHILPYEFCPLKYKFTKLCKFKTFKDESTFYGIYLHKVIEKIYKKILNSPEKFYNLDNLRSDVDEIGNNLEQHLRASFSQDKRDKIYEDTFIYLKTENFENIIGSEVLEHLIKDEYILEGTIDLIRKNGDKIEIIDFKTGKYDEKKFFQYKRQLETYCYLLKNTYNLSQIETYLYYISDENKKMKVEIHEGELLTTIQNFDTVVKNILNGNFPPREFDENCNACEFRWFCKSKLR